MTVNKKHIFNATFINVIIKVIISKVFISIVVVSLCSPSLMRFYLFIFVTGQAVGLRPDAESSKETGQRSLPLN